MPPDERDARDASPPPREPSEARPGVRGRRPCRSRRATTARTRATAWRSARVRRGGRTGQSGAERAVARTAQRAPLLRRARLRLAQLSYVRARGAVRVRRAQHVLGREHARSRGARFHRTDRARRRLLTWQAPVAGQVRLRHTPIPREPGRRDAHEVRAVHAERGTLRDARPRRPLRALVRQTRPTRVPGGHLVSRPPLEVSIQTILSLPRRVPSTRTARPTRGSVRACRRVPVPPRRPRSRRMRLGDVKPRRAARGF